MLTAVRARQSSQWTEPGNSCTHTNTSVCLCLSHKPGVHTGISVLIQQHEARCRRVLSLFVSRICVQVFPPPRSSPANLELAALLTPPRLGRPELPTPSGRSSRPSSSDTRSEPLQPLPPFLDARDGGGLGCSERGSVWFVVSPGFHCSLVLENVYAFQTKGACCRPPVSRRPSLPRDDCGPRHTDQLPCFRSSLSTG